MVVTITKTNQQNNSNLSLKFIINLHNKQVNKLINNFIYFINVTINFQCFK